MTEQGTLSAEEYWQEIYKEIQDLYLEDKRPWIIGYSGGKDSTATLQFVWYAISELPKEKRKKRIYVISSDTFLEIPPILTLLNESMSKINQEANNQDLPIIAQIVTPVINDTFWVNLIGRGYPAPTTRFRWCTERMKIRPANRFIEEKISQHGEVIIILGVRKSESATREQIMKLHQIKGSNLSRHTYFARAFVYTPIKDFTKDDVWDYLLKIDSPWKGDNYELARIYRSYDGECPLVIDDTTPPCGNSRFGCWVCTVIVNEKMLQSMIDSDEDWVLPLVKVRNKLVKTQEPKDKHIYRTHKRRNGQIMFKRDGSGDLVLGPYFFEFRKNLLKDVLNAQLRIQKEGPNPDYHLILPEELHAIRRIWITEENDWEDSLPKIYREVMNEDLDWIHDDSPVFSIEDKRLLERLCNKYQVPEHLLMKLLNLERELRGMNRRAGIFVRMDQIFKEEWRSKKEILNQTKPVVSNDFKWTGN